MFQRCYRAEHDWVNTAFESTAVLRCYMSSASQRSRPLLQIPPIGYDQNGVVGLARWCSVASSPARFRTASATAKVQPTPSRCHPVPEPPIRCAVSPAPSTPQSRHMLMSSHPVPHQTMCDHGRLYHPTPDSWQILNAAFGHNQAAASGRTRSASISKCRRLTSWQYCTQTCSLSNYRDETSLTFTVTSPELAFREISLIIIVLFRACATVFCALCAGRKGTVPDGGCTAYQRFWTAASSRQPPKQSGSRHSPPCPAAATHPGAGAAAATACRVPTLRFFGSQHL